MSILGVNSDPTFDIINVNATTSFIHSQNFAFYADNYYYLM